MTQWDEHRRFWSGKLNRSKPILHVVAALNWRDDDVLLVHQQAPENPAPSWALPGGIVEPGELLCDALAREVQEETGLTVHDPGRLLYVAQTERQSESWAAFIFEIQSWSGTVRPVDPDQYILDARFLPVPSAISKFEDLPWRHMREPIIAYLQGRASAGSLWCYREGQDSDVELILQLDSMG